jgi:DNA mismatch repair protein MutS
MQYPKIFLYTSFIVMSFACQAGLLIPSIAEATNMAMRQNLAGYSYEEPDWPENNARFEEYLHFVYNIQDNLQENAKRRASFKIIQKSLKNESNTERAYVDPASFANLDIFTGQVDSMHYLANIINRTQSTLGFSYLCSMIATPTVSAQTIQKKQNIIKYLLDNPQALHELQTCLQAFKEVENHLLVFWLHDAFRQAVDRRYFNFSIQKIDNFLNQSSVALNVRNILDHEKRCILAAAMAAAGAILPVFAVSKALHKSDEMPAKLNTMAEGLFGSGSPLFAFVRPYTQNDTIIAALALGSGMLSALYAKDSYNWATDNFVLDQYLNKKINHIALAIKTLYKIKEILHENPELKKILNYSDHLDELFNTQDSQMQQFLSAVKHHRIATPSPVLCNTGNNLLIFRLLSDVKYDLEKALLSLAEVDAYVGLAQLYQEHENTENAYCFAQLIESEHPVIDYTDFWNPAVRSLHIITNSVHLGVDQTPISMIITGPNAGGKSTILKSIAIATLMTQSLGITPARTAYVTIFNVMMSYLNIVDDLAGGNSLFKNQVRRLQQIYTVISSNLYGKNLLVIDEMFNGTSPVEALACALSVAYLLGLDPHTCSIIATHHKKLTELASVVRAYKNYHVNVCKTSDGKLSYPFQLAEGVSDQHIAIDILQQEGFNNQIIQKAQELVFNQV